MSNNAYRDDYERTRPRSTALIRVMQKHDTPSLFAKLLALVIFFLCIALGVVGVILPIIPGLLFFAFAAMLAATLFPGVGAQLRKVPGVAPYLDSSHGFADLSWPRKCRFVLWITAKVMVDSLVVLWLAMAKLVNWVMADKPRY
jgi:uncharacterized membrane protein YbaN (DUF454 family)